MASEFEVMITVMLCFLFGTLVWPTGTKEDKRFCYILGAVGTLVLIVHELLK